MSELFYLHWSQYSRPNKRFMIKGDQDSILASYMSLKYDYARGAKNFTCTNDNGVLVNLHINKGPLFLPLSGLPS